MNARAGILAAAIVSLVLGFLVPGPIALAAGMLLFFALPLLARPRLGTPVRAGEGLRYATALTAYGGFDLLIRVLGILSWLVAIWASTQGSSEVGLGLFAGFAGLCGAGAALVNLVPLAFAKDAFSESVTLDRETMTMRNGSGTVVLPYVSIERLEPFVSGHVFSRVGFWIIANGQRYFIATKHADQVRAAIEAAQSSAAKRAERAATGPVELKRPAGMGPREWLARLDALAASASASGAYRGAGLDEAMLWAILDDEREDAAARAGAARLLSRGPDAEVHVRIAESAKAIKDPDVRIRVEVATKPDAEEAAAELEALELEELRQATGA